MAAEQAEVDCEVGDYVEIGTKGGKLRRGFIRFEGKVKVVGHCYGIELDEAIDDGTDGSLDGEQYFTCDEGRGKFVKPQKIKQKLEIPSDGKQTSHHKSKTSRDRSSSASSKKGGSPNTPKKRKSKIHKNGVTRSASTSSPRKKKGKSTTTNTSQSTPGSPHKSRDSKDKIKNGKKSKRPPSAKRSKSSLSLSRTTSARHTGAASGATDEDIVVDPESSDLDKMDYIYGHLSVHSALSHAKRVELLKVCHHIIEEEKCDDTVFQRAINGFKKVFTEQMKDKKLAVHKQLYLMMKLMMHRHPKLYKTQNTYFLKTLMNKMDKLKDSETNELRQIELVILCMIKEIGVSDKKQLIVMLNEFVRNGTASKSKRSTKKVSWSLILKALRAKHKAVDVVPGTVLDSVEKGLKQGLSNKDKTIQKGSFEVLELMATELQQHERVEKLFGRMSASAQKAFHKKAPLATPPWYSNSANANGKRSASASAASRGDHKAPTARRRLSVGQFQITSDTAQGMHQKKNSLEDIYAMGKRPKSVSGGKKKKKPKAVNRSASARRSKITKTDAKSSSSSSKGAKGGKAARKSSDKLQVKGEDKNKKLKKTKSGKSVKSPKKQKSKRKMKKSKKTDSDHESNDSRNSKGTETDAESQRNGSKAPNKNKSKDDDNERKDNDQSTPTDSDDVHIQINVNGDGHHNDNDIDGEHGDDDDVDRQHHGHQRSGSHTRSRNKSNLSDLSDPGSPGMLSNDMLGALGLPLPTDDNGDDNENGMGTSSDEDDAEMTLPNGSSSPNDPQSEDNPIQIGDEHDLDTAGGIAMPMSGGYPSPRAPSPKSVDSSRESSEPFSNFPYDLLTSDNVLERGITWKMLEYLCQGTKTHELMAVLSRMDASVKIHRDKLDDIDYDDPIPDTLPLFSEEEAEMEATNLSWNLMRLLSTDNAHGSGTEAVSSYLLRQCQDILLHSLAVFHTTKSSGNVYHGRVLLEILLNTWPKSLMSALTKQPTPTESNVVYHNTQILFKNALFRNLHQGNLNSFFLDLICYKHAEKYKQILPWKKKIIQLFKDWKFMEYLLHTACSYKVGVNGNDDVPTKMATFFIDLVARSSAIEEVAPLFENMEHVIIDSFMEGILDEDGKRTTWHRMFCGQILIQFMDICSRPTIMDPAALMAAQENFTEPEPSPNILYPLFDKCLKRLHSYIPQLSDLVINYKSDFKSIRLNYGIVRKPFGQIRLHCLELLTISADFAQFECGNVLGMIPLKFWTYLLEMAFLHKNNNIFLCHFRRLIHLTMIFRRRILKHLFVEKKMLDRFIQFYVTEKGNTPLHGYVLQMVYDIWQHDQEMDDSDDEDDEDDDDSDGNDTVVSPDEDAEYM